MNDMLDVDLQDPELIAEIHLVTELMVLALEAGDELDQQAIDRVLGVRPAGNLPPPQRGR